MHESANMEFEEMGKELREKLSILPPTDFESASSILDFERFRELSLDWTRCLVPKCDGVEWALPQTWCR